MIKVLLAQRQEAIENLNNLVSSGGPDAEKEVLADKINELSQRLVELGHSDAESFQG